MVKDRLGEADCKENGWLLDGFPRTGAQAEALVDIGVSPDYVLLLDVPDEQLIKRVVRPPPPLSALPRLKGEPLARERWLPKRT
jgi:adenylate kinase